MAVKIQWIVDLTHSDERPIHVSFSEGSYGFVVRAETKEEAVAAVIARAKRDGFWGHDWRAQIVPAPNGRRPPFSYSFETVELDLF